MSAIVRGRWRRDMDCGEWVIGEEGGADSGGLGAKKGCVNVERKLNDGIKRCERYENVASETVGRVNLKGNESMSDLSRDLRLSFDGQTILLRNFVCGRNETLLFDAICTELGIAGNNELNNLKSTPDDLSVPLIDYSEHQICREAESSKTFNQIVHRISECFNLDVLATRLNYYRPDDYKPFHHDSHAWKNGEKEDLTVGVSLGQSRDLCFRHVQTGASFNLPQHNGDLFAFNDFVNKQFMHGVSKMKYRSIWKEGGNSTSSLFGGRISIIAWGKRRSKNNTNSGRDETYIFKSGAK